jgi:23S rRNA pseudouridine955/2504/2580 synthase/23S rRNA pseudouridine1911/1915/1917 synthase
LTKGIAAPVPPLPPKLEILLDTPDLIAIHKPAGLATIPGRGETTSALEQLAKQIGLPASGTIDPRVRVVHRLDKDTSGVLLFAKHTAAQRHLSHQFQNNQVRKEYLAIVAGQPPEDAGEVDARIGVHPANKRLMTVSKQGRPAMTAWQVERRFRHLALLRVFPKTGKTHQIRVHLRHAGMPLAVDPLYNPTAPPLMLSAHKRDYRPTRGEDERPLIARLTLHAHKIRFQDLSGVETEVVAEPPKDFRASVNQLGKTAGR